MGHGGFGFPARKDETGGTQLDLGGEKGGAVGSEFDDELAEKGVGPGEPGAGEAGGIVFLEGLVHEAGAGRGVAEPAKALANFGVAGGGDGAVGDGHGPDGVDALVGAADTFGGLAAAEVGVAVAEGEAASALVEQVGGGAGLEIGEGDQAGGVGVVDEQRVAVSIDFVGPELAKVGVVGFAIFLDGVVDLGGERAGFGGKLGVVENVVGELDELAQTNHGEHVGGNEEGVDAGVVGWTKHGVDQAVRDGGIAEAAEGNRVAGAEGLALEGVGALVRFALLGAEGADDGPGGFLEGGIEGLGVAGGLPEAVGEAKRVAERIDLPLALADAGMHVGLVVDRPTEGGGGGVAHEGVGVGVEDDHAGLAADEAFEQFAEFGVFFGERQIGPHLGGGVAEPHRIDVAGDDVGVGLAFVGAGEDGGVESVGKAVFEDGGECGVGDAVLEARNESLNGGAGEVAVGEGGAGVGQFGGTGGRSGPADLGNDKGGGSAFDAVTAAQMSHTRSPFRGGEMRPLSL